MQLASGRPSHILRLTSLAVLLLAAGWAGREYASSRALKAARWTEPRRVVLRSVAGLKIGSPVTLDGVRVGVIAVSPVVRRDLRGAIVRFDVAPGTDLRTTDEAAVMAGLGTLGGATLALLTAGPTDAPPWRAADAHRGVPALTVDALAAKLDRAVTDFEGFSRTAVRLMTRNQDALSAAVSGIATLAGELAGAATENRAELHRTLAALASIAARADSSRIVESVDLLTDQLARSLPAITRDTGAILATGAQLATTATAILGQVAMARKAVSKIRLGAESTTLYSPIAHGIESDLLATAKVGSTEYRLGYESGQHGGADALARRSLTDGLSWETGTLRGAPALGLGAFYGRLSADVFRIERPELRLEGSIPVTGPVDAVVRVEDVTHTMGRAVDVGVRTRW